MQQKPFLNTVTGALTGEPKPPPIWLMRQAGRYLPEYRAVREQAGGFLNLCYNPVLAEQVTLQPIRRFGFDAAILFADILLIPDALGQRVWFETGEGPRLDPISSAQALPQVVSPHGVRHSVVDHLAPVIETVSRLSKSLPPETTLIGFAGAPWTVATYMVAGRGTPDQMPARELAETEPQAFQSIIDRVVAATIDYLAAQVDAGAEVLQLFESWAGSLQGAAFEQWCIEPVAAIIAGLRARHITVPIIAFPRAAQHNMADYVARTGCQILGLDSTQDRAAIVNMMAPDIVLQGNLDPMILLAGGDKMRTAISAILDDFKDRRFIFNLGHGIVPQTPPEHVSELVALIRGER